MGNGAYHGITFLNGAKRFCSGKEDVENDGRTGRSFRAVEKKSFWPGRETLERTPDG